MSSREENNDFLEKLYIEMYPDLHRFAALAFSNRDIAQDIIQDTFLIAQNKIDDLTASPSPRGWLFNTLKNVIGNTYKQQKKALSILLPLSECDKSTDLFVSVQMKYGGLIDDDALKLLIWVYCENLSYQEIADKLGISLSACKKRIQRARENFKRALESVDEI